MKIYACDLLKEMKYKDGSSVVGEVKLGWCSTTREATKTRVLCVLGIPQDS